MKNYQQTRTAVAAGIAVNVFGYPHEEGDQEFLDFIESISLNHEELMAFIAMPESSISDIRRLFADRQRIHK